MTPCNSLRLTLAPTSVSSITSYSNQQYLDLEKKRSEELSHLRKVIEDQFWCAHPIDEMNMSQLKLFKKALEDLRKLIPQDSNKLVIQDPPTQTISFFV